MQKFVALASDIMSSGLSIDRSDFHTAGFICNISTSRLLYIIESPDVSRKIGFSMLPPGK